MNNMSKPKISIKEILAHIKAYESEKNLEVLQKYVEKLMKDEVINEEESDYEEVLNECLERITNRIFHLPENFADEQIILRTFLFIFSVKKINILEKENLDANDLRIKSINNACKLIKLCVETEYFFKIDYYVSQIRETINKVEEFYRENELVSKQIKNKKTEIMLYNIEKMVKQSKLTEAMEELNRQKDCIVLLNTYHEYYVGLCYNISLKCIQDDNYDYALTILLLAYDICKVAKELSKNMKTILHFLVCVCWRYNPNKNWSSAINALELANKNEIDIFYITSKIKFASIAEAHNLIEEALNQATEWEHLKINDICQIVQLLQKNELLILAADFVQTVKYKLFSMNDKFLLMKLEIQIYISGNDRKLFSLLDHAVEFIKNTSINESSVLNLCKLLTSHADIKFKEKMFEDSLILYDYGAKICEFKGLDRSLKRHIHTRICLCYIEVDNWKSARNKFEELRKCYNKDDPFYVYLALQVAFMGDDEKLAEDALRSCDESDTSAGDILLSCCQKALTCGKKDILLKILEVILQKYHTPNRMMLVAKLCQCLIVLCTNYTDGNRNVPEKYLLYMDKALHDLQQNPENEEASEMSQWFSRAAWNLALTSDMEPKYIFEFFLRCCCFSEISVGLNRLKNSLMLAAASGLHVVRKMNSKEKRDERDSILRKIMTVIEKCKSLENGSNLTLLRLLYLYEFEARCHLNQWEDENVTEILRLPFMDVKTLEHIAAIVNKHSPHSYKIIMESLKAAVQKISDGEDQETAKASKTYHSLVQVLFYVQEYFSASVEEENLALCRQLLILIEKKTFHHYPELEILWLMIKCWNWGIQKLTMNDPKRAYKWCTLAMTFLQKLESLKSLHEKKLNEMYAAYFSNFKNEKENPP